MSRAGAAFEHRERGEKQAARPLRAVQRLIGETEIVQIVGDERVGRAEPHLIDRGRLLQKAAVRPRAGPSADTGSPAATGCARSRAASGPCRRRSSASASSRACRASSKRSRAASAAPNARSGSAKICARVALVRFRPRVRPRRAPLRHRRGRAPPAPARRKSPPRGSSSCASGSIRAATISSGSASSQRRRSICACANAITARAVAGDFVAERGERDPQRPPAQRRELGEITSSPPVFGFRFEERQQRRAVRVFGRLRCR